MSYLKVAAGTWYKIQMLETSPIYAGSLTLLFD